MAEGEVAVVDRAEFLKLTGLEPEQLDEVERIGLVMPYFKEGERVLYNQDDVKIAREAIAQIYRFGLDPKDFRFYLDLGHQMTDQEVRLRRKVTNGLSAKENIQVTTYLTRAVGVFRNYILRRLLQQKIQDHIQSSLGKKGRHKGKRV